MKLDSFCVSGKFLMLALDHRQSIKKLINRENPDSVNDEEIIGLKKEIIGALEDQFSVVLIDELGLRAYQTKAKPYIMPLEKSGSEPTELEYSAQELINFGASGAKLLVKFNLDNQATQLSITREALKDCKSHNLPFFLEIVTDSVVILGSVSDSRIDSGQARMTENALVNSVKKFLDNKIVPDVFKLEYPGSLESCQNITGLVGQTPWILLTGGNTFEVFKEHLRIAIRSGAKGFLAGRALWQELPKLAGQEKEEFLKNTLPQRFRTIASIAKESS